mgnify:CR=1 FL=1
MIVLTLSGIMLSFGLAINSVLSSNGILNIMLDTEYLEKSENEAKTVLTHYMSDEKADKVLQKISTKSSIRQITEAFDNNNVGQVANNVRLDMKQAVLNSLEDNSRDDTKDKFATVVSDAYIKSIFPVTEVNLLSNIYSKIGTRLNLALIIISIVAIAIYIYLATGKKTYKWAIISLYNVIILNIILTLVLGTFNGIVIGNDRTTDVIIGMLNKIKINIVIATIITFAVSVISNYVAYFKKRKHSK